MLCSFAYLFAVMNAASAQSPPPNSDDRLDLTRFVPGDAQFYVELNDLEQIQRRFRDRGIWRTVRELAGPTRVATTPSSDAEADDVIELDSDAAIARILGRRSALIATASAKWQTGVIIAELQKAGDVRPLLNRWRARRLPDEGSVRRYVLAGGVLLAALNRLIVLGPGDDPEGLWGRTVSLLAGKDAPHLHGRSDFAAMRARLRETHAGLAYVTWPEGDPYAIADCERLIAGFSFTDSEIRCEIHGQRAGARESLVPCDAELIRGLPGDTLAAWSGSFDSTILRRPPSGSVLEDQRSIIGLFLGMLAGLSSGTGASLAEIGPRATILLGANENTSSVDPSLPPVTILCEAGDAAAHVNNLDVTVGFFVRLLQALVFRRGEPSMPLSVQTKRVGEVEIHFAPVGPILALKTGFEFLRDLDLCWAAMDGRALFSTSRRHVEQIIQAARRKTRRLDDSAGVESLLPAGTGEEPMVEWALLRGTQLANEVRSWLGYVRRNHPEALRDKWWQAWAFDRLSERTRLGVGLKNDRAPSRRAIVHEVDSDSPAAGILRVDDAIITAAGKPLVSENPAREVAQRYRGRGRSSSFQLVVMRDGMRTRLRIPVAPAPEIRLDRFEPIRALRLLIVLLRGVETVSIARHGGQADRLDLDVRVYWASGRSR